MKKSDAYRILGASPSDSKKIIKSKYLNLIKKYHPDTYKGDDIELAAEKAKEIINAYETVCNEDVSLEDFDLSEWLKAHIKVNIKEHTPERKYDEYPSTHANESAYCFRKSRQYGLIDNFWNPKAERQWDFDASCHEAVRKDCERIRGENHLFYSSLFEQNMFELFRGCFIDPFFIMTVYSNSDEPSLIKYDSEQNRLSFQMYYVVEKELDPSEITPAKVVVNSEMYGCSPIELQNDDGEILSTTSFPIDEILKVILRICNCKISTAIIGSSTFEGRKGNTKTSIRQSITIDFELKKSHGLHEYHIELNNRIKEFRELYQRIAKEFEFAMALTTESDGEFVFKQWFSEIGKPKVLGRPCFCTGYTVWEDKKNTLQANPLWDHGLDSAGLEKLSASELQIVARVIKTTSNYAAVNGIIRSKKKYFILEEKDMTYLIDMYRRKDPNGPGHFNDIKIWVYKGVEIK